MRKHEITNVLDLHSEFLQISLFARRPKKLESKHFQSQHRFNLRFGLRDFYLDRTIQTVKQSSGNSVATFHFYKYSINFRQSFLLLGESFVVAKVSTDNYNHWILTMSSIQPAAQLSPGVWTGWLRVLQSHVMQHTIEMSRVMHKTGLHNIRTLSRHFKKVLTNASSDCVADIVNLD